MKIWHLRPARHKKAILISTLLLSLCFFFHIYEHFPLLLIDAYHYLAPNNLPITCHSYEAPSLPDISDANPKKGKTIFFHETSCTSFLNGKITIRARQACAVESAAKMNPNLDVYLLFASPGVIKDQGSESDRFLSAISSYRNLKIYHLDVERYMKETPIENLWRDKIISRSRYAQSHMSDVLRYLTLWKYGGIYLDLDVVVIKSLEELPLNYAGAESNEKVAAGVLSFNHTGIGHEYVEKCLNDLSNHFSVWDWGYNGPGTITRLLRNLCGVNDAAAMAREKCGGFKVYPPEQFYAIPWWNWKYYLDENENDNVFQSSNKSHVVHVWNKFSASVKIPLDSNVSYLQYAKKYCPKVIQQCDQYF